MTCVEQLPYVATGSTVGGLDNFSTYSCAPNTAEGGLERVYRVTLPGPGTLAVALDAALEQGATDVDVHILELRDPTTCLSRGDRTAQAYVDGTTAWVVLDSYVRSDGTSGEGPFQASFTFFPAGSNPLLAAGVTPAVADFAFTAYTRGRAMALSSSSIFTVIDFSLPSFERRLWTVDMASGQLLVLDRVSHGSGSNSANDPAMASDFSNTPGSNQSSLGLFVTAETYDGSNGYSLRLDGLEASNSNMRDRAIVVHGAWYAEDSFVDQNGYLGRSNGCPALAASRVTAFIDLVKDGKLMFAYFPDDAWLAGSPFLQ